MRTDRMSRGSRVLAGRGGFALVTVIMAVSLLAVTGITLNRTGGLQNTISHNLVDGQEAYYTAYAGIQHALYRLKQVPALRGAVFSNEPFGSGSYTVSINPENLTLSSVLISSTGVVGDASRLVQRRVILGQIFSVYPALVKDTTLSLFKKSRNFGASDEVVIGLNDKAYRGIFQYDLSIIPSEVTIESAYFELYMYDRERQTDDNNEIDVKVHRVTRSWNEGAQEGGFCESGATWNTYDCINSWTSAGGDYDSSSVTNTKVYYDGIDQWYQWDIKNLVKDWVSGERANRGFILRDHKEENETKNFIAHFYSGEYSDENYRPRLVVTYTVDD